MNNTSSRTLPQRWVLALGAAGIFVAGFLLGSISSGGVFAASRTTTTASTTQHAAAVAVATPFLSPQEAQNYCQIYEQKIVSDLSAEGVTASELETANYDAIQAVLQRMVADKKITQAQATQIVQQLALLKSQPCQNLGQLAQMGKGAAPSASQMQLMASARSAVIAATAEALNLTPDQLQSGLAAGQTVTQIAASQKVQIDTVNTAYLGAMADQLKAAVSSGAITQAEADQLTAAVQMAVNAGHYPLLEGSASLGR